MIQEPKPLVVETEPERVARLLRELGDTADAVAERLSALGHLGVCASTACPLFHYLAAADAGIRRVTPSVLMTYGPDMEHTDATREFVRRFDDGEFQFLRSDE